MIGKCPVCGGALANTADFCPHCGHRNRPSRVVKAKETLDAAWQLFLFCTLAVFLLGAGAVVIAALR